uniref:Uncharacterized protein n=1 Tax=Chromera velia CCMP2878 TaxID=1169474 RepID=A0A0G4H4W0_9ALVE|eukprot:Cvel_24638.t1-p1 / transcript=Cvel_24638.t1 / gene=Cvel_24638 / organism=Chromera_velia_CCMP2878 / gene_product=hypothetical protein / transcript_product=hypothetical protein / location=Cvel_scaffold2691:6490-13558(-) / protein_length=1210 / sequence_SO=supercontig / SO=protein_coding / is_pseudo=false
MDPSGRRREGSRPIPLEDENTALRLQNMQLQEDFFALQDTMDSIKLVFKSRIESMEKSEQELTDERDACELKAILSEDKAVFLEEQMDLIVGRLKREGERKDLQIRLLMEKNQHDAPFAPHQADEVPAKFERILRTREEQLERLVAELDAQQHAQQRLVEEVSRLQRENSQLKEEHEVHKRSMEKLKRELRRVETMVAEAHRVSDNRRFLNAVGVPAILQLHASPQQGSAVAMANGPSLPLPQQGGNGKGGRKGGGGGSASSPSQMAPPPLMSPTPPPPSASSSIFLIPPQDFLADFRSEIGLLLREWIVRLDERGEGSKRSGKESAEALREAISRLDKGSHFTMLRKKESESSSISEKEADGGTTIKPQITEDQSEGGGGASKPFSIHPPNHHQQQHQGNGQREQTGWQADATARHPEAPAKTVARSKHHHKTPHSHSLQSPPLTDLPKIPPRLAGRLVPRTRSHEECGGQHRPPPSFPPDDRNPGAVQRRPEAFRPEAPANPGPPPLVLGARTWGRHKSLCGPSAFPEAFGSVLQEVSDGLQKMEERINARKMGGPNGSEFSHVARSPNTGGIPGAKSPPPIRALPPHHADGSFPPRPPMSSPPDNRQPAWTRGGVPLPLPVQAFTQSIAAPGHAVGVGPGPPFPVAARRQETERGDRQRMPLQQQGHAASYQTPTHQPSGTPPGFHTQTSHPQFFRSAQQGELSRPPPLPHDTNRHQPLGSPHALYEGRGGPGRHQICGTPLSDGSAASTGRVHAGGHRMQQGAPAAGLPGGPGTAAWSSASPHSAPGEIPFPSPTGLGPQNSSASEGWPPVCRLGPAEDGLSSPESLGPNADAGVLVWRRGDGSDDTSSPSANGGSSFLVPPPLKGGGRHPNDSEGHGSESGCSNGDAAMTMRVEESPASRVGLLLHRRRESRGSVADSRGGRSTVEAEVGAEAEAERPPPTPPTAIAMPFLGRGSTSPSPSPSRASASGRKGEGGDSDEGLPRGGRGSPDIAENGKEEFRDCMSFLALTDPLKFVKTEEQRLGDQVLQSGIGHSENAKGGGEIQRRREGEGVSSVGGSSGWRGSGSSPDSGPCRQERGGCSDGDEWAGSFPSASSAAGSPDGWRGSRKGDGERGEGVSTSPSVGGVGGRRSLLCSLPSPSHRDVVPLPSPSLSAEERRERERGRARELQHRLPFPAPCDGPASQQRTADEEKGGTRTSEKVSEPP